MIDVGNIPKSYQPEFNYERELIDVALKSLAKPSYRPKSASRDLTWAEDYLGLGK